MALALVNGRVLTPNGLTEGLAVVIDAGRIAKVCAVKALPKRMAKRDLAGGILAPGFLDVQVNGGGGVLFNDRPSVEGIEAICRAHRRFGTTGFLPTLISDELDVVAAALDATRQAIEQGVPGVLGVHIEGPFLSAAHKGVHDARKFRRLDERALKLLTSFKAGRLLVTLAPEETTPGMIRRLVAGGAIVSAGHTNAAYAQVVAALEAGLSGFTHIFNAMSPLASRAPGAVGAALEHQDSWCGMIVDGRHVDPVVLKLALKCKPRDKFMLVTDAMPTVGTKDKTFTLQGRKIMVKDGVCIAPDGALAGAALDMSRAIRNAVAMLGLSFEDAAAMASRHPARFLGLSDLGTIAPGQRASLALLDDTFAVRTTWIDGGSSDAGAATRKARSR
jgi:N-acetylglucosamine-6-phosphate deacetylase